MLPQSLHFDTPSPHIPWNSPAGAGGGQSPIPWQPTAGPPRRRQLLRVHRHQRARADRGGPAPAIEAEADRLPSRRAADTADPPTRCWRCRRSPEALVALARRYEAWLAAHPDADLADVCFTAGTGRSHFEHRAALVVDSVPRPPARARRPGGELATRPGVVRGETPTTDDRVAVHRAGQPVSGDGPRIVRRRTGFAETVKRCADASTGTSWLARCSRCCSPRIDDADRTGLTPHLVRATGALRRRNGTGRAAGSRGIENPTWCWGTAWVSTRRRASPGVFSLEDGAG